MVVIKRYENTIPVDFGEFTLNFAVNDKNLKELDRLGKELGKLEEQATNMKGTTEDLDTIFNMSKDIWTSLFDEDVFTRVYSLANESSISCLLFAIQMIKGLLEEIGNTYKKEKLLRYLED
jgi:hypothetical protein